MSEPSQHSHIIAPESCDRILHDVWSELKQAEGKFPLWPNDIIHGFAIVAEEAGEAVQAALQCTYDGRRILHLRAELVQTAAMAIRMIADLDNSAKEDRHE